MSQLHYQPKWAIFLVIIVLLFGSACTLFSPPPPPSPPPEPDNQSPIIHYMTADKEIALSGSAQIRCVATDKDKDTLSYRWSVNGGTIEGAGDDVTWIPPDSVGDYTIKVIVTDGRGGEAMDSVTISVTLKPNQPPIIISLAAEEQRVRSHNTTIVECIAEDPDGDELSFIWSATGGTVHGEGVEVGWIAPGVAGDYVVTVTVSDGRGGKAKASVDFKVVCCGH